MALTLILIGGAALFIGTILLLIATFRESLLWGLANLFVPAAGLVFICVHWQAGRAAFFWTLAGIMMIGGGLVSSSTVRDTVAAAIKGDMGSLFAGAEKEEAEVTSETIDVQRRQIEQKEAQFHAMGAALAQQYQALNAKRSALKADDAAAVTIFNAAAAAYQQTNTEHKQLRQQIDAAHVELTRMLDERSRLAARPGAAAGVAPANQGTVIIYTTSRCGWCDRAKEYFAKKGVRYDERNVDKSDTARAEFEKLGGRGVPLIMVGNEKMEGFDEQRLNQLL